MSHDSLWRVAGSTWTFILIDFQKFFPALCLGASSGGGTPVPIPNTAVKPSSADGSELLRLARVGRRQDTVLEVIHERKPTVSSRGLSFPYKVRLQAGGACLRRFFRRKRVFALCR